MTDDTRRRFLRTAAGALALSTTPTALADGGTAAPTPPADGDWGLVFEDTFDGDSLDRDKWDIGFGWGRDTTASYERITDDNVTVSNGELRLTCDHDGDSGSVTAGAVHTKNKHAFGPGHYFEARLRAPNRYGWLPAFWAKSNKPTPNWPPEIDFFEALGNDTHDSHHNIHYDPSGGMAGSHDKHALTYSELGSTTDYHIYGCAWFEDRIEMYVDGQHVGTHDDPTAMQSMRAGAPFYMMLNIHVGKTGEPDFSESWDETMAVDWVRVWEHGADSGNEPVGEAYDHSLTVTGTGRYSVDVTGDAVPDRSRGSHDPEDSIDGNTISGTVGGGTDAYYFNGDVASASADSGVRITVDGARIATDDTSSEDEGEDETMSDYNTITVPAGQTRRFTLGSGDSLENTLIDITADGAEYRINCSGDGWAVRNVGIRGRMTNRSVATPWTMRGNGTVEHVYLGDGGERNGMFVLRQHSGHIDIDRAYIANFRTNGLYASPPGNGPEHKAPGGGGDVVVTNSYGKDNRIANFRLGTDGSRLESSVSIGGMRPYWGYYHDTTLVDCDLTGGPIVVGDTNYQTGKEATVTAENCRYDVNVARASPSNDFTGEPQGDPDTSVPAGVPTSAAAAAAGGSASGGDDTGGDTGNEDESETDSDMADYNTITVPSGQTRSFQLGSGDTLENTLIDITASGANFRINCRGSGWAVRNVGIKGRFTSGGGSSEPWTVSGNGVIENVYLGDGGSGNATGIFVMNGHSGDIEINRLNVQGWTDNGLYASACGNGPEHPAPGGQGTVRVHNSYGKNNDVANFRLGTDGSYLENCVSIGGGRTYWGYYGDTVLRDCDLTGAHVLVGEDLYRTGREATVTFENCRYDCAVHNDSSQNSYSGASQGSPDLSVPAGVPTTAEAAASGTADSGSGGSAPAPEPEYNHIFVVRGSDSLADYGFEVDDGEIVPYTGSGATFDPEDAIDAQVVTGNVHGGRDAYAFDGELVAVDLDGGASLELDGEPLDHTAYPSVGEWDTGTGTGTDSGGETDGETGADGSDTAMRTIVVNGNGAQCDYEFTVSTENIKSTEEKSWWSFNRRDSIDGNTVTGRVIGGADAYLFEGELETLSLDGDYESVTLDGEPVDPADYTADDGDDSEAGRGDGDEAVGVLRSQRVSASGDGETTAFKLPHTAAGTPAPVSVEPRSSAASSDFYVSDVTDGYIEVTYSGAPAAGNGNLVWQLTVQEQG